MKKIGKRLILILSILTFAWGCIVGIDYLRAHSQYRPLFAIAHTSIANGGTTLYYGIGYTVTDYNEMPEYGGRTDIVFHFTPMPPHVLSQALQALVLLLLPVLFCFLFYKFLPRLLFLAPLLTVSLYFLAGCLLYGPPTTTLRMSDWLELIAFILYHLLWCAIFYVYRRKKQQASR